MAVTTIHTRSLLKRMPNVEIIQLTVANDCYDLACPWELGDHYDLTLKLRQHKIKNIIDPKTASVVSWFFRGMLQKRDGLKHSESAVQVKHPLGID